MTGRFVALGDSFTEGIGDTNLLYPNGVRGWADRLARLLGKQERTWEYANFAIRSKRLDEVVDEQLEPALALRPTLISFHAGGNDILALRTDMDDLMQRYEAALRRLHDSGAQLVLFTGFDVKTTPLLEALRRRNEAFGHGVRELAAAYDAVLVDQAAMTAYANPLMWCEDRIHMSKEGHRLIAFQVLRTLGHGTKKARRVVREQLPEQAQPTWRELAAAESRWIRRDVLPLVQRRLRGVNEGMTLPPKWPVPIRPAEGMKRLAGTMSGQALLAEG